MHYLKQRRWVLIPQLLLAATIALTILIGQSQTSQAASFAARINTQECQNPGNLVQSIPVTANGSTIAELDIYYSNATHYNCAYLRDSGPAWGAASHISVDIHTCQTNDPTAGNCVYYDTLDKYNDSDTGSYKYYAGPAGVDGEGKCIFAEGSMTWKGKTYEAWTPALSDCD